jgi:hypothetical protein
MPVGGFNAWSGNLAAGFGQVLLLIVCAELLERLTIKINKH